ncbi:MAG: DndE family protein [Planctomycetales bacterium]|nr:DndE family protein [Planctomycetales bacterium]
MPSQIVPAEHALLVSGFETSQRPTPIDIPTDSNVEMNWYVFGGEHHELYLALIKQRCINDRLGTSLETMNRQLRLHLHRGIGYLATPNRIRSIGDLVALAATSR